MAHCRRWTEAEIEFLHRTYPKYPAPVIAKYLKRTPAAVHIYANRLGIRKPPEVRRKILMDNLASKRKMPRHIKEALGFYDCWRGGTW